MEAEKRQAKEDALLHRQKEAKEIADQKKRWEDEIAAQKKKEDDKLRAIEEQAERERQERLQKIKNMDLESNKVFQPKTANGRKCEELIHFSFFFLAGGRVQADERGVSGLHRLDH